MKVVINVNKKPKHAQVGDILVFNGKPYMIISCRRKIDTFDLMGLDGDSYWTGDLSWSRVLDYVDRAEAHYSQDEYILELKQK